MSPSMYSISILALFCIGPHVVAQQAQPENQAMEAQGKRMGLFDDIRRVVPAKQGVREFSYESDAGDGLGVLRGGYSVLGPDGKLVPSTFHSNEEADTHDCYCEASSIVVVSLEKFEPKITADKTLIYTLHEFTVVRLLKPFGDLKVGDSIYVEALGGEVQDGGETIRMNVKDAVRYNKSTEYLLFLDPLKNAPPHHFTIISDQVSEVRKGRLYPANVRSAIGFSWGEGLNSAMKRREDLIRRVPCDR